MTRVFWVSVESSFRVFCLGFQGMDFGQFGLTVLGLSVFRSLGFDVLG